MSVTQWIFVIVVLAVWGFLSWISWHWYKQDKKDLAVWWVEERKRLVWVKCYHSDREEDAQQTMEDLQAINPDFEYRKVYE